jgi:hypothetical protein
MMGGNERTREADGEIYEETQSGSAQTVSKREHLVFPTWIGAGRPTARVWDHSARACTFSVGCKKRFRIMGAEPQRTCSELRQ